MVEWSNVGAARARGRGGEDISCGAVLIGYDEGGLESSHDHSRRVCMTWFVSAGVKRTMVVGVGVDEAISP